MAYGHGECNLKVISKLTYTHVSDALLVNQLICIILVRLQKAPEPTLDLLLNALCCYPVAEGSFDVLKWHVQATHGKLQHTTLFTIKCTRHTPSSNAMYAKFHTSRLCSMLRSTTTHLTLACIISLGSFYSAASSRSMVAIIAV